MQYKSANKICEHIAQDIVDAVYAGRTVEMYEDGSIRVYTRENSDPQKAMQGFDIDIWHDYTAKNASVDGYRRHLIILKTACSNRRIDDEFLDLGYTYNNMKELRLYIEFEIEKIIAAKEVIRN